MTTIIPDVLSIALMICYSDNALREDTFREIYRAKSTCGAMMVVHLD